MYLPYLIVFVIILIVYCSTNIHREEYENYLTGHWVSPMDFNEESQISSMMFQIGDYEDGKRQAYLLINDDISNQGLTLSYSKPTLWFENAIKPYTIDADVEFSDEDMWNDQVSFELDILQGKLLIYHEDTVYAVLYKDFEVDNYLD